MENCLEDPSNYFDRYLLEGAAIWRNDHVKKRPCEAAMWGIGHVKR